MGCSFSSSSKSITSSHEESSIQRVTPKELADDIWYEIFLYLPLDSIFRFRYVSKLWFLTLSNPNFISQWYKVNSSSLPWVLAYNVISSEAVERRFKIAYAYSHSHYVTDHQSGFSFRFLKWANTNLVGRLFLLGSSNGLVLCATTSLGHNNQVTYYVCNPLTKKWISLPPPPKNCASFVSGFICDECSSPCIVSTSYKVVRIPKFETADVFEIEIFSSDSGNWVTYGVSCPQYVTWTYNVYNSLIIHDGVLYWNVGEKRTLIYDCHNNGTAGNYRCRMIGFPEEEEEENVDDGFVFRKYGVYDNRSLGVSEGFLCYAFVNRNQMTLSVWVLEDDWHLLHKDIELHDTLTEMNELCSWNRWVCGVQLLGLHPQHQNTVLLGWCNFIWAYNIQTRRSEKLSDPYFCSKGFSVRSLNIMIPFVLKPRPTEIPPSSWIDHPPTSWIDN